MVGIQRRVPSDAEREEPECGLQEVVVAASPWLDTEVVEETEPLLPPPYKPEAGSAEPGSGRREGIC